MAILQKTKPFHGNILYHQRVTLGFNQQQVADKIGRSKNAISRWETGKSKPNPKSLFLLAKTLKVKPEYFFSRNGKNISK